MRASERNGVGHESRRRTPSKKAQEKMAKHLRDLAQQPPGRVPNYKPSKRMAVTCFDHWKFIILEDFWDDSDPNLT